MARANVLYTSCVEWSQHLRMFYALDYCIIPCVLRTARLLSPSAFLARV